MAIKYEETKKNKSLENWGLISPTKDEHLCCQTFQRTRKRNAGRKLSLLGVIGDGKTIGENQTTHRGMQYERNN